MKYALIAATALLSLGAAGGAGLEVAGGDLVNGGALIAFATVVYRQGERTIARLDQIIASGGATSPARRRRPAKRRPAVPAAPSPPG